MAPRVRVLTFDQQVQILRRVAELAEQMDVYRRGLHSRGYRSFLAWDEFNTSFCCADEMDVHARRVNDNIKRSMRSPHGVYLEDDRREWQAAPDPCEERLRAIELSEDRAIVDKRRAELARKFVQYREEERRNTATMNAKVLAGIDKTADYLSYFTTLLGRAFRDFGFTPDERRSKEHFPVVSKPVNEHWDICWSPESDRTFIHQRTARTGIPERMPVIDLECYLSAKGARGFALIPIGFDALSIMRIRLASVVHGFSWAYARFDGIDDLVTLFSARACLYRMAGEELEDTLRASLAIVGG